MPLLVEPRDRECSKRESNLLVDRRKRHWSNRALVLVSGADFHPYSKSLSGMPWLCCSSICFVALALYDLLKGINRRQASLMVTHLRGRAVVGRRRCVFVCNQLTGDILYGEAWYGFDVAEIFWGLWLFPLGLLVYRSRLLARFLAVWPAIDEFAYVILSLTGVLLPQYQNKVFTYAQPAFFGEVALMLWIVIKSARPPALDAAASSSASACWRSITPALGVV